jgi:hypothetical protein
MAPVLFLFLISAFAETLKTKWKNAGIGVCTVRSFIGKNLTSSKGKLRGHPVEILQCLYVDDGSFIFALHADMMQGLELVYRHFGHLGLEMHISQGDTSSKTECVVFPPPWLLQHAHACLACPE